MTNLTSLLFYIATLYTSQGEPCKFAVLLPCKSNRSRTSLTADFSIFCSPLSHSVSESKDDRFLVPFQSMHFAENPHSLKFSFLFVSALMPFFRVILFAAAHTVIVKGTDVYNPEKGKMIDLSILDVQQIFGRAGRPQFDTSGEATLITNHEALPRYIDKLVRAVPIESNFIQQLADHLNAEVVGGTVTSLNEAVTWIGYTYLFVRMKKNPLAYGINADQFNDDPTLRGRCMELVQQAVTLLAQNKMMNFHPGSGNLSMTDLGRVAAHFYVQAESVKTFNDMMELNPSPSDSDLCRIIASATEFTNLRVRQEEQTELDGLQETCPLKYDGKVHDAATKSFVLMQAFISRTKIKSFTLISDTNYIAANAGKFE